MAHSGIGPSRLELFVMDVFVNPPPDEVRWALSEVLRVLAAEYPVNAIAVGACMRAANLYYEGKVDGVLPQEGVRIAVSVYEQLVARGVDEARAHLERHQEGLSDMGSSSSKGDEFSVCSGSEASLRHIWGGRRPK